MNDNLSKLTRISTQPFKIGSTTIDPKKVRKNIKKGKSSKELVRTLQKAVKDGIFSL